MPSTQTPSFDLEKEIEEVKRFAQSVLKDGGSFVPTWVAYSKDTGDKLVIGTPWKTDEEKDRILLAMKMIFAIHNVDRYILTAEVWQSKDPSYSSGARHDPKKTEHLLSLYVDGEEKIFFSYEMTRTHDDSVMFGPEKRRPGAEGPMTELLPAIDNPVIEVKKRYDYQKAVMDLLGIQGQEINHTEEPPHDEPPREKGPVPDNVVRLPILATPLSAARRSTDPL